MKILFVDCETTGLNPVEDRMVEIGVSLYCTETKRVLRSVCFITNDDTIKITPEISKINGITQEMLDKDGVDFRSVFALLGDNFVDKCNYLCAHNAPFDKAFIEAELKRAGFDKWQRPWIDTCVDLPISESIATRKLTYLAAEHGFVNRMPHTALGDVFTTILVFMIYDLPSIIKRQASPSIIIAADVDYANREKASKRGFRWNGEKKRWLKVIKASELPKERHGAEFEISIEKE